jgi:hypothetical protein
MTSRPPLFVRYGAWHHVDGDEPEIGTTLGEVYLTLCYRWLSASVARERGWQRGRPPGHEPVCMTCDERAARRTTKDRSSTA